MTDELMFSASSGEMRPLRRVSLQEAGFRERDDLQEWVIQNPALLGGEVMVVTAEFDRWIGAGGVRPLDRLDLLAVRSDGTLLVAELKRGEAPDTVEMQAVKYAALSSEFSAAQLAEQHARFVTRRGETINEDEALERLFRFAPDLPDEGPRIPEVVLIAESFPAVVTATTVFLDRVGLAMRLITVGAYQTERGEFIVSAKQIYPLPELDELKVRPRSQERTRAATARGGVRVAQQLLDAGKPEPGTRLTMHPRRIPADMRDALIAWIAEDNQRAIAIWEPAADPAHPLRWVVDDNRYSLTGLVKEMARRVGFDLAQVAGPSLWAMPDGQWLPDYANEVHGASATARVGAEAARPAADDVPRATTPLPDR